jgi:hypothetical protein
MVYLEWVMKVLSVIKIHMIFLHHMYIFKGSGSNDLFVPQ